MSAFLSSPTMASAPGKPSAASTKTSPKKALRGVYTSTTEVPQLSLLPVIGEIPRYVAGNLFRNGPGLFELTHADGEVTPLRHWFDGISMLHRFKIDGAALSVEYMSRTTATAMVRSAASVPKRAYNSPSSFGVMDPCKGIFGKMMSLFVSATKDPRGQTLQNVGVTVESVPGKGLMSRTDTPTSFKIDAETLEVAEFESWAALELGKPREDGTRDKLVGHMSAAHGEFDDETGEYFNFVFSFGREPVTYKVFRVDCTGAAEVLAEIPYRSTYCHSIALTKKYVVLILYPEFINPSTVLFEKNLLGAMHFDASAGTKFFVISREEGRLVATHSAPSFWAFHVVNAFDGAEGELHIDLCSYEDGSVLDELYVENLRSAQYSLTSRALIRRYTLSGLAAAASSAEPPPDQPVEDRLISTYSTELVRINPRVHLKDYRYAFGPGPGFRNADSASSDEEPTLEEPFSTLLKIDVKSGEALRWSAPNHHCSEAIFVPDPSGTNEDDGALLSVCYDGESDRSFLLVLDARNMRELARAYCPVHVPAGFHGDFSAF